MSKKVKQKKSVQPEKDKSEMIQTADSLQPESVTSSGVETAAEAITPIETEQAEPTKTAAPKKISKPEEEEIEIVEERMIPINLGKVRNAPRKKRAPKAVKVIRNFVKKHMKVDDIKISNEVNELIWKKSIEKPPRRIEVRAVKDKEGKVILFAAK